MSRHSSGNGGLGVAGLHSSLGERFRRHIGAGDWQSCLRLLRSCVATCHDYTTLPCARVIPFLLAHHQWREVLRLQPALLRASTTSDALREASAADTPPALTSSPATTFESATTTTRAPDDAAALLVTLATHGRVAGRVAVTDTPPGSSPQSDFDQLLSIWLLALLNASEAVAEGGCAAGVALLCRVALTRNGRLSNEALIRGEQVVAGWCAEPSRYAALTPSVLQELQLAQDYLRAELKHRGLLEPPEDAPVTGDTTGRTPLTQPVAGVVGTSEHVIRLVTDLVPHNVTHGVSEVDMRRGRRAVLRHGLRQLRLLAHTTLAVPRQLAELVYTLCSLLQVNENAEDEKTTVSALRVALHAQPAVGELVCRTVLTVLMTEYRTRRLAPDRQGGNTLSQVEEDAVLLLACLTLCCVQVTHLSHVQRTVTEATSEAESERVTLPSRVQATLQLVHLVRDYLGASPSLPAPQPSTVCAALDELCVRQLLVCSPRHVGLGDGDAATTAQASLLTLSNVAGLALLHRLVSALICTLDAMERAESRTHLSFIQRDALLREGAAAVVQLVQQIYKYYVLHTDPGVVATRKTVGIAESAPSQQGRLYALWSVLLDADPAAFLADSVQRGRCHAREQLLLRVLQRSECGADLTRCFDLAPSTTLHDAPFAVQQSRFPAAVQLTARLVLQFTPLLPRPRRPASHAATLPSWIAEEDASDLNCPLADTSPQDLGSDVAASAELAWAVPSETLNTPSTTPRRRETATPCRLGYSAESVARQLVWWALQTSTSSARQPRHSARELMPSLRVYLHALPSRPRTALCLRLLDGLPAMCADVLAASSGGDIAKGQSVVAAVLLAVLQQPDAALTLAEQAACVRRGLAQVVRRGGAGAPARWWVALHFLRECPAAYYQQHESAVAMDELVSVASEPLSTTGEQPRSQPTSLLAHAATHSALAQLLYVLLEETRPPRWHEALEALHRAAPAPLPVRADTRVKSEDDQVAELHTRLTGQERDALRAATRQGVNGASIVPALKLYRRFIRLKRRLTVEELTWLAPVVHRGSLSFASHVLEQLHGQQSSTPLGLAALRCAARCHKQAAKVRHVPVVLTQHRCYALGMQALRCLASRPQVSNPLNGGCSPAQAALTPTSGLTHGDFGTAVRCVATLTGGRTGLVRRVLLQSGLWAADGVLGAAVHELRQTVQLCRDGDDAMTALRAYREYRRVWHGAPVPATLLLQLMQLECAQLRGYGTTTLSDVATSASDRRRAASEMTSPAAAAEEVRTRWHSGSARQMSPSPVASLVMLLRDGCMQTSEVVYGIVPEMRDVPWRAFLPAAPTSLARFLPAALSILLGCADEALVRNVDMADAVVATQMSCIAAAQPAALVEAHASLLLSQCLYALRRVGDGATTLRCVNCLVAAMEAIQRHAARHISRVSSPALLGGVAKQLIDILTRRRAQAAWPIVGDATLCVPLDVCLYRLHLLCDAAAPLARLIGDDEPTLPLDDGSGGFFARFVRDTAHDRHARLREQLAALTLPSVVSRVEKVRGVAHVVRVWSATTLSPLALHIAALHLVLTMWQEPSGQALLGSAEAGDDGVVRESPAETLHGLVATTRLLVATHQLICHDELAMSVVRVGQLRQATQSALRGARYRLQRATECVARYVVEWWVDSLEDTQTASLLALGEERAAVLWLMLQLTTLLCVAAVGRRSDGAATVMRGAVERLERVLQTRPSASAQNINEAEWRVERCVTRLLLSCTAGTQELASHGQDDAVMIAWRELSTGGETQPGASFTVRTCYARLVWLAMLPSLLLSSYHSETAQVALLSQCAKAVQTLLIGLASSTLDRYALPDIEAVVLMHAVSYGVVHGNRAYWGETARRLQDSAEVVLLSLTAHCSSHDTGILTPIALAVDDSSDDSLDVVHLVESSALLVWLRCTLQPWQSDGDSRVNVCDGGATSTESALLSSTASADQAREEKLQGLVQSLSVISPDRTSLASLLIQHCPLPTSAPQVLFTALARRLTAVLHGFGPWPICRLAELTISAIEASRFGGCEDTSEKEETGNDGTGNALQTMLEAVTPMRVRCAVSRGAYAVSPMQPPPPPSLSDRHDGVGVAVLYALHAYTRRAAMTTARVLLGQPDLCAACGSDEGVAACGAAVQQWVAMLRPELARRPPLAALLRTVLRNQTSKTICILDDNVAVEEDDTSSATAVTPLLLLQNAGVLEDTLIASASKEWRLRALPGGATVEDAVTLPHGCRRAFAYPASQFTIAGLLLSLLPPRQGLSAEVRRRVHDALCAPWRRVEEGTQGGDGGRVIHDKAPHGSGAEHTVDDASLLVNRGAFNAVQYAVTRATALPPPPQEGSSSAPQHLLVQLAAAPHTQAVLQYLSQCVTAVCGDTLAWWCIVWNVTLIRLAELTRDARLHGRQRQSLQEHRSACEIILHASALTAQDTVPLLCHDVLGYWLTSFLEEAPWNSTTDCLDAMRKTIELYMEAVSPELRAALISYLSRNLSQSSTATGTAATVPPPPLPDVLRALLREHDADDGAWWAHSVWPPLFWQRAALVRFIDDGAKLPRIAATTLPLRHPLAVCEALERYMLTPHARANRAEAVRHLAQGVRCFVDTGICHVERGAEAVAAQPAWRFATTPVALPMPPHTTRHLRGTGGAVVLDTLLRLMYTTDQRVPSDTTALQDVLEAIFPSLVTAQGDARPREDYTGYVPLSWNVLPPMLVAYVGSKKRRSATAEHVVCVLQRLHEMAASTAWLASRAMDGQAAVTAEDGMPAWICFPLTARDASHLLTFFLAALTQARDFVTPLGWHAERQATLHTTWTALLALLTLLVRGACGGLAEGNVWSMPLVAELRRLYGDDVMQVVSSCELHETVATAASRTPGGQVRRFVSPRALLRFLVGAWRHGDHNAALSRMLQSLLSPAAGRSTMVSETEYGELQVRKEAGTESCVELSARLHDGTRGTAGTVWRVRLNLPTQDRRFPWLQVIALLRRGLRDHGLLPTHATLSDLLELALSHAVEAAGDTAGVAVRASYAMGGIGIFDVVAPYMLVTSGMHETLWLLLLLLAADPPRGGVAATVVETIVRLLRRFQSVELTPVCTAAMARLYARLAELDVSGISPAAEARAARSLLLWRIVCGLRALNEAEYSKVILALSETPTDASRATFIHVFLKDIVDYLATDPHRQTAYDEAFIETGARLLASCGVGRSQLPPCARLLERVLMTMTQRRSVGPDRRRQVPRSRALHLYARYTHECAGAAMGDPWPRLSIHVYLLAQGYGEVSLLSWQHTLRAVLWPAVQAWRRSSAGAAAKTAEHTALIHQAATLTIHALSRATAGEEGVAEALCVLWDVVTESANAAEPPRTLLSALYLSLHCLVQVPVRLDTLSLRDVLLPKLYTLQALQQKEDGHDKGVNGDTARDGLSVRRARNRLAVLARLARRLAVRPTLSSASAVELAACLRALQTPLRTATVHSLNVIDAHDIFCQAYLRRLDKSACYEQMLRFVVQTSYRLDNHVTHAMLVHACSIVLPAAMTEALALLRQPTAAATTVTRDEALRTLEQLLQAQRMSTAEAHMHQLRRALHDGAIDDAVQLCRRHHTLLLHSTAMTRLCCELVTRRDGAAIVADFATELLTNKPHTSITVAEESSELHWLRPPAASLTLLTALTRGFVRAHPGLVATTPPSRVLWAGAQVIAMLIVAASEQDTTAARATTLAEDAVTVLREGLTWLGQQLLRDRHMCDDDDDDAASLLTCFWTSSPTDDTTAMLATLASVVDAHVLPALRRGGSEDGCGAADDTGGRTRACLLDVPCQRRLVRLLARGYPNVARQLWVAMTGLAARGNDREAKVVTQFFDDYCKAVDACMVLLLPSSRTLQRQAAATTVSPTRRPVTRDALDAVVQWRERAMFGGDAVGRPYRVLAHFAAATEAIQIGCSATGFTGALTRLFAVRLTHLARIAECLVACDAPVLFSEVALYLLSAASAGLRGGGLPFALAEAAQVFVQAADQLCNNKKRGREGQTDESGPAVCGEGGDLARLEPRLTPSSALPATTPSSPSLVTEACAWNCLVVEVLQLLSCAPTVSNVAVTPPQSTPPGTTLPLSIVVRLLRLLTSTVPLQWYSAHCVFACGEAEMRFVSFLSVAQHLLRAVASRELRHHEAAVALAQAVMTCLRRSYELAACYSVSGVSRVSEVSQQQQQQHGGALAAAVDGWPRAVMGVMGRGADDVVTSLWRDGLHLLLSMQERVHAQDLLRLCDSGAGMGAMSVLLSSAALVQDAQAACAAMQEVVRTMQSYALVVLSEQDKALIKVTCITAHGAGWRAYYAAITGYSPTVVCRPATLTPEAEAMARQRLTNALRLATTYEQAWAQCVLKRDEGVRLTAWHYGVLLRLLLRSDGPRCRSGVGSADVATERMTSQERWNAIEHWFFALLRDGLMPTTRSLNACFRFLARGAKDKTGVTLIQTIKDPPTLSHDSAVNVLHFANLLTILPPITNMRHYQQQQQWVTSRHGAGSDKGDVGTDREGGDEKDDDGVMTAEDDVLATAADDRPDAQLQPNEKQYALDSYMFKCVVLACETVCGRDAEQGASGPDAQAACGMLRAFVRFAVGFSRVPLLSVTIVDRCINLLVSPARLLAEAPDASQESSPHVALRLVWKQLRLHARLPSRDRLVELYVALRSVRHHDCDTADTLNMLRGIAKTERLVLPPLRASLALAVAERPLLHTQRTRDERRDAAVLLAEVEERYTRLLRDFVPATSSVFVQAVLEPMHSVAGEDEEEACTMHEDDDDGAAMGGARDVRMRSSSDRLFESLSVFATLLRSAEADVDLQFAYRTLLLALLTRRQWATAARWIAGEPGEAGHDGTGDWPVAGAEEVTRVTAAAVGIAPLQRAMSVDSFVLLRYWRTLREQLRHSNAAVRLVKEGETRDATMADAQRLYDLVTRCLRWRVTRYAELRQKQQLDETRVGVLTHTVMAELLCRPEGDEKYNSAEHDLTRHDTHA